MKAVEFIKKFGWDFAIAFSNKGEQLIEARPYEIGRGFIDELKRYVDAWELVKKYGGLQKSKSTWNDFEANQEYEFYGTNLDLLKQAIALVEEVENFNG